MLRFFKRLRKKKNLKVITKFEKLVLNLSIDKLNLQRVKNLLKYTKNNDVSYNGQFYEYGYHSFILNNEYIRGQREIDQRFSKLKNTLKGKNILDIGSNQGGVLFYLSDVINYGIGIDYDFKMINVSNKIRFISQKNNLEFYCFDLQKEKYEVIDNLISTKTIDVVLLLSVCIWIKNWKQLIDYCYELSNKIIFETNGTIQQQNSQINYLHKKYKKINIHSEFSDDDLTQKNRKLLICSK